MVTKRKFKKFKKFNKFNKFKFNKFKGRRKRGGPWYDPYGYKRARWWRAQMKKGNFPDSRYWKRRLRYSFTKYMFWFRWPKLIRPNYKIGGTNRFWYHVRRRRKMYGLFKYKKFSSLWVRLYHLVKARDKCLVKDKTFFYTTLLYNCG